MVRLLANAGCQGLPVDTSFGSIARLPRFTAELGYRGASSHRQRPTILPVRASVVFLNVTGKYPYTRQKWRLSCTADAYPTIAATSTTRSVELENR